MSIDWITVFAQIANFLVLVWLLKKFLYRPILDGIDAREAEISKRMQEARVAQDKAEAAEQEHLEQMRRLKAQQADISRTVQQEAEKQRDALMAEAQEKMESARVDWRAHLDAEGQAYTAKLHRAGGSALLSLTRKALDDLADTSLEDRMAHRLSIEIAEMAGDLQTSAGGSRSATVTSSRELSGAAQDELTATLAQEFKTVALRFQVDPAQACGITLRMGGAQVDWTVQSYLDTLDAQMDENLAVQK